jgi:hypothetical protein
VYKKKRNEKTKEKEKEEEEGEEAFVKSSPKFFMKGDETER